MRLPNAASDLFLVCEFAAYAKEQFAAILVGRYSASGWL